MLLFRTDYLTEVLALTLNIIQQFFLKLFSVFLAMSISASGTVAPPSTENTIKAKDADNVKLVFAVYKRLGNIKAEGQISTLMSAKLLSV